MAGPSYVHLHTHSEFSLLDGAARMDRLVERAASLDMPALALTDHGVMYGALDFYEKCKAKKIKPIIGVEAYITSGSLTDKTPRPEKNAYHLLLLAQNTEGYKNLLALTTVAAIEGFYYKPRIDRALLECHHKGIIATSACLGGEVCAALLRDDYKTAVGTAAYYRDLFGHDNYYIELQDHTLEKQAACNVQLIRIARELGLKLICTNDVHYIQKSDAPAHEVLLCVGTGTTITDEKRLRYGADEFYMKSAAEMHEVFCEMPEVAEQTAEIAERCNLDLAGEFGSAGLPMPTIPDGHTPLTYLRHLAYEGLDRKVAVPTPEHRERLEYELGVIETTGFAQYILIVRDFAIFAREKEIIFGVRGSAAGSFASYCVDITDIDSVEYDLTFERFLNPERVQMPDIDMDFEDWRRSEVIEYVTQKYGKDHVAQIVTFGTLAARAAIKDCGRALGMPIAQVNSVVNLIPTLPIGTTIAQALNQNAEFKALYDGMPDIHKLVDTALSLEGLARHASVHAAGVVISNKPLVEYTPLQKSQDDAYITQYPAKALEKLGLLKMDFLGLVNLTILGRAVENIKSSRGVEVDLSKLPLDDADTFAMLGRGETTGIFQLESSGMRRYIAELKPTSVRDLAAMVALYRPGPMNEISAFIRAKQGRSKIKYPHPLLEPVLKETYGIIVYQDQVMRIAQALAGYSMGQADLLRRAMGKKQMSLMEAERERFVQGAAAKGVSAAKANEIFTLMEPFAGYGFNKAHAVCYAMVAYQTAWLKAKYPVEYMAALLTCYQDKPDKMASCKDECRRMHVTILPPDVNRSGVQFTAEASVASPDLPAGIRFGLAGIKGVGRAAVDAILAARATGGEFVSLEDLCRRVQAFGAITRSTLEALVRCGAFDSIHPNRRALCLMVEPVMRLTVSNLRALETGQGDLFGSEGGLACTSPCTQLAVEDYSLREKLAAEKELVGIYLSGDPLARFVDRISKEATCTIRDLGDQPDKGAITVGGIIGTVSLTLSKQKREPMSKFVLEDSSGGVTVLAWPQTQRESGMNIAPGNVVLVRGKLSRTETAETEEDGQSAIVEVRADSVLVLGVAGGASAAGPALHICVGESQVASLPFLRRALEQHSGLSPVYLHVPVNGTSRRVRAALTVHAETAMPAVWNLIGDRRLAWVE